MTVSPLAGDILVVLAEKADHVGTRRLTHRNNTQEARQMNPSNRPLSSINHGRAALAALAGAVAITVALESSASDLVVNVASGTETFSYAETTIADRVVKTGSGTLVIPDDTYTFAGGFVISNGFVRADYERSGLSATHIDIVGTSSSSAVLQVYGSSFTAPLSSGSTPGTVALLGYAGIAPWDSDLTIDFGGDGRTLVNGLDGFSPTSWQLPATNGKNITLANDIDLNGRAFEFKPSNVNGATYVLGAVTDSSGATAGSNVTFWEYGNIVFVGTRDSANPRTVDFLSFQFNNYSAKVSFSNATIRVTKDFYMGHNSSSSASTKFFNCDKATSEGWDFSYGGADSSTLVDGGTFHAGGRLYIGDNAARPHSFTIAGGAVVTAAKALYFKRGTVNQESGSLASTGTEDSHIGDAVGDDISYYLRSGYLTFKNNDVLGFRGRALLHQTGGNVSVAKWFGIGRGNSASDMDAFGRIDVYGGAFTHQKPADNVMMRLAEYGTGVVAVASSGVLSDLAVMGTSIANTGASKGTVFLHRGGTYETAGFYAGTGNSALVFNGGTLRLLSDRYAADLFPASLKRVVVSAIGGTIDTNGKGDFTITRPLVAPTDSGDAAEAALKHRWTFDGESLADTAGGSDAVVPDGASVAWEQDAIRLLGTAKGTSRVNLGTNLLPTDGTPATIEITFTVNRLINNARLFDIGSDGQTTGTSLNDLWFCPHSLHSSSGKYYPLLRDKSNRLNWHLENVVLETGVPYHLTVVLVPNGSKMDFYYEIRNAATGALVGRAPETWRNRHFCTTSGDVSMADGFGQANGFWLGYSCWNDTEPAITYHDIRIYHEELDDAIMAQSVEDGPEARFEFRKQGAGSLTLSGANSYKAGTAVEGGTLALASGATLPATSVRVAAGAILDLGGAAQSAASLEGSGSVRGGSLAVSGRILPGGAGNIGTLTLDGTALTSGTLAIDFGADGACDTLVSTGSVDLSRLSLEFGDTGALEEGNTYTFIRAGAISGSFASMPSPMPRGWGVSISSTKVTLCKPAFVIVVR